MAHPGRLPLPWPVVTAATVALLGGVGWLIFGRSGTASSGASSGLNPRRVAVLYFADLSPDSSLGYLADGLTEGLIDELAPVRSLDVISRNGVTPFRHADVPRDSIARSLGAGTLVEGSVETAGPRVRVTLRLVDGASGADFRRESFELPSGDALAIRDSLARQAALVLRERLGEEIRVREQRAGTRSAEAWTLVQQAERGRKDAEGLLARDRSDSGLATFDRADSLLSGAERADRRWATPAIQRGQLAYRRARLLQRDRAAATRWIGEGLAHAERALAQTPNDPAGLELRGTLHYYEWLVFRATDPEVAARQLEAARRDLEAAVEADPSRASGYSTLSHLYYQVRDRPAAVLAARRAYEEDAYLSVANDILWRLFIGSYDLEQFAQADRWCAEGGRRFPRYFRFGECGLWLMTTPAGEPDVADAWRLVERVVALAPPPQRDFLRRRAEMLAAGAIARAGLSDSARRVLERARATPAIDPEQELLALEAFIHTLRDDPDTALALLQRYVAANPGHAFNPGGNLHWWWRELRNHPGFRSVLGTNR